MNNQEKNKEVSTTQNSNQLTTQYVSQSNSVVVKEDIKKEAVTKENITKETVIDLNNKTDIKIKMKLDPNIPLYFIKFKNPNAKRYIVHKIYNPLVTDKTLYFGRYKYNDQNSRYIIANKNVNNFYIECSVHDEKTLESKIVDIIHIPNYYRLIGELNNVTSNIS